MIKITKFPVVIVSNYRTGSSALAERVGQYYNIPTLIEPCQHPAKMDLLLHMLNQGDLRFCCKFHIDQIHPSDIHSQLLALDCYKIKITRKDVLSQIASYYIASVQNTWKQEIDHLPQYTVPLDLQLLDRLACVILDNNNSLRTCNIIFDAQLEYQMLNFNLANRFRTTQPTNIEEVIQAVEHAMHKYHLTTF